MSNRSITIGIGYSLERTPTPKVCQLWRPSGPSSQWSNAQQLAQIESDLTRERVYFRSSWRHSKLPSLSPVIVVSPNRISRVEGDSPKLLDDEAQLKRQIRQRLNSLN